jgi:geranylgeranyl pyrophosphate synthase
MKTLVMDDITKFLEDNKDMIDSKIMKYLPVELDKTFVEWAFGKARYSYDIDTLRKALSEPVWDFLNRGGKRWRPALFLLITEAMGGDPEKVRDFVIVPELAHNGSIMIDDIEDSGELRRGKPCTHKIYGVDVAINAGNFMYFLPTLAFIKNRKSFDDKVLLTAYEIFSQEMINIHIGQGMDIWWHKGKAETITEDQYMQMCAYKTGTLARMSAKLAVTLSGGSTEQVEKIGKFAEAIGVAFQIQDDILSATEEGFQDKKGFGDDVTEGKRTLMVIHTLSKASPGDRKRLLNILNMHTRDEAPIREALSILRKYGSVEYAKGVSSRLVREAWSEVEPLLKETEAKRTLKSFADFMVERKI